MRVKGHRDWGNGLKLKREGPRTTATAKYTYRRQLEPMELMPALGVGVAIGAISFYVAYLFLQRTPLEPKSLPPAEPKKRLLRGAAD